MLKLLILIFTLLFTFSNTHIDARSSTTNADGVSNDTQIEDQTITVNVVIQTGNSETVQKPLPVCP